MSTSFSCEHEVLYKDLEAECVNFTGEDVGAPGSKVRPVATFRIFDVLALSTSYPLRPCVVSGICPFNALRGMHHHNFPGAVVLSSQHLSIAPFMSSRMLHPCRTSLHTYRTVRSIWQTSSPLMDGGPSTSTQSTRTTWKRFAARATRILSLRSRSNRSKAR